MYLLMEPIKNEHHMIAGIMNAIAALMIETFIIWNIW